jgi:hypothetical protein
VSDCTLCFLLLHIMSRSTDHSQTASQYSEYSAMPARVGTLVSCKNTSYSCCTVHWTRPCRKVASKWNKCHKWCQDWTLKPLLNPHYGHFAVHLGPIPFPTSPCHSATPAPLQGCPAFHIGRCFSIEIPPFCPDHTTPCPPPQSLSAFLLGKVRQYRVTS